MFLYSRVRQDAPVEGHGDEQIHGLLQRDVGVAAAKQEPVPQEAVRPRSRSPPRPGMLYMYISGARYMLGRHMQLNRT